MLLWKILQNSFFLQGLVSWFYSRVPFVLEHNLGKYAALRKAFYLTALEQLEGDYLEFGVFTGSSFVMALRTNRQLQKISDRPTSFFGFDSFEGFGDIAAHDQHPFYRDNFFKVSAEKVMANIKKHSYGFPVTILKGFFNDSFKKHSTASLGIQKIRVALIDCDLMEPAKDCLFYIGPHLQKGSVLILDDFFSYHAADSLGLSGALSSFLSSRPDIKLRHLYNYGFGGAVFLVSDIKE